MKTLYTGKFLKLLDRQGWEYVDRPASKGVVQIVATYKGSILVVEQFRWAQGAVVISLPGGLVEDSTENAERDLEAAAHRELLEETGFAAGRMAPILTGPISPGMTTETITFFVAHDLRPIGPPRGDGDEVITLHQIPAAGIFDWLKAREETKALVDLKLYLGLALGLGLIPKKHESPLRLPQDNSDRPQ